MFAKFFAYFPMRIGVTRSDRYQ